MKRCDCFLLLSLWTAAPSTSTPTSSIRKQDLEQQRLYGPLQNQTKVLFRPCRSSLCTSSLSADRVSSFPSNDRHGSVVFFFPGLPPPSLSVTHVSSLNVLSLLHQCVLLCDALSSQLFQNIVQVPRVREAVARQVGAKLCLVVNLKRNCCI